MPAEQIFEGVLLMIGGVLLLTPGFVTDFFGFLCLIPPTRKALVRFLKSRSVVSLAGVSSARRPMGAGARPGIDPRSGPAAGHQSGSTGNPNPNSRSAGGSDEIIDGDFHRID